MRFYTLAMLNVTVGIGVAALLAPRAVAADESYRVEYTLKSPRSREPVLGGEKDKLFVQVWIPKGVKVVRGGICNPFSKGGTPSGHWQEACRLWQFAYVQTDLDAVKREEYKLLFTGLEELAKKSGRAELAQLPMCFTGMSRGGGQSMALTEMVPDRTIATVPVCLEVGPSSEASRKIPVLTIFGEKDGKQMSLLLDRLPKERQHDAHYAIAVQWGLGHEFARANNLSMVFFDDVIRQRVPKTVTPGEPVKLADYPLEQGVIGKHTEWKERPPGLAALPGDDPKTLCWLPSRRVAMIWQSFVSPTAKLITIAEPAGLGDKQKFRTYSPDEPISVRIELDAGFKATRVLLYDGDREIGQRGQAPWEFSVKLPVGIHSLYALADTPEGQTAVLSRPHTIFVNAAKK